MNRMEILVMDVGGTHVKVYRPGHKEAVKIWAPGWARH
jgi:hypothetical protein